MRVVKGDLLSATEGYIVHGCNCQGVMGSGVALAIKRKYPKVYASYVEFCFIYGNIPSDMLGRVNSVYINSQLRVLNAFTQEEYGRDGKQYASYKAIEDVLIRLSNNIDSQVPIHMPKIGCGLGGATWEKVELLIKHHLPYHNVIVYEL